VDRVRDLPGREVQDPGEALSERHAVRDGPHAAASLASDSAKLTASVTVLLIDRPLTSDSENVTLSVAVLAGSPSVRASDSANVTLSVMVRGCAAMRASDSANVIVSVTARMIDRPLRTDSRT
jgi:hypothetical protein